MRWRRTVEYAPAPVPRRPRDNPWIWVALLAVAVVALLLVVWALARADDGGRERRDTLVPNLIGLDQADAGQRAEAAGYVPDTFGVPSEAPFGQVIAQQPDPGVGLAPGEHLRLNVSQGTEARPAVTVPDVVGSPAGDAREALRRLALGVVTRGARTGRVTAQQPAPGSRVQPLTQVTITVGG